MARSRSIRGHLSQGRPNPGGRLALLALLLGAPACGPVGSPSRPALETAPVATASLTQTPASTPLPSRTPAPSLTPTPVCAQAAGTIVEDSYPGLNVPGPDPMLVYLPPCYSDRAGPFPVLYLFHGKPFSQTHWIDLGVVKALEASGRSDWVLVMPKVPEPLFSNSDGGPGSYEDEFLAKVLPYVESHYRVRSDAGGRGIGGISRGGVWSLEIGLRHSDIFSLLVALSPALAVNSPRPAYDPLGLAASVSPMPAHVFLGAGTDDWARPATEKLADALQARGSAPDLEIVPGAHESSTWESLLPGMLAFVQRSLDGSPGAP